MPNQNTHIQIYKCGYFDGTFKDFKNLGTTLIFKYIKQYL